MIATYILQNTKGMYYIGSTSDLEKRLEKHKKGYSRFTKSKGPFKIVYREIYNNLAEAKKREYYLKSLKSRKFIEKLIERAAFV
ncbi:MAG: GIY-YIG nuclease family protein [Patescibacteria group bacterium]|nr:GIY-YIG nuclease family protein [Patescibacteria group bacterium]MCL5095350.1 GIY-YIG nuclease family protein [Patescibacteria group bacterium]